MPTRAAKRKPPERTFELEFTGPLKGYRVLMGSMSTRHMIQFDRQELDETQILELVVQKVIEHDFDIPDLLDLDFWIVAEILQKWSEAQKDAAVPPTSETPSAGRSSRRKPGRRVSNSLGDTSTT